MKIYLAGAMGCYGAEAKYPKIWRDEAKNWFANYTDKVTAISPVDYYAYGSEYQKTEREIMNFDLHNVKISDLILVNLLRINESPGTIQEVFYAWNLKIPVIGFIKTPTEDYKYDIHPWLYEQINRIEYGKDAMEKALHHIRDYYIL